MWHFIIPTCSLRKWDYGELGITIACEKWNSTCFVTRGILTHWFIQGGLFMQLNHLSFGDYAVCTFSDDLVYICSQVSLGDRSQRAKTALCTMGASVFRLTICIVAFGNITDCNICSLGLSVAHYIYKCEHIKWDSFFFVVPEQILTIQSYMGKFVLMITIENDSHLICFLCIILL